MTYYDKIKHFEVPILEMLISEAPHTSFNNVPPEFKFLTGGLVDLGFENIPDKALSKEIYISFTKNGVAIPGTQLKMRAEFGMKANIEPTKPNESLPTLPDDWMEFVHVIDPNSGKTIHKGSKLGAHQFSTEM